jgi:hypothetical protein
MGGRGTSCPRNGRQHSHIIDIQILIYMNRGESKLSFGVIFISSSEYILAERVAESRQAPSPKYFSERMRTKNRIQDIRKNFSRTFFSRTGFRIRPVKCDGRRTRLPHVSSRPVLNNIIASQPIQQRTTPK